MRKVASLVILLCLMSAVLLICMYVSGVKVVISDVMISPPIFKARSVEITLSGEEITQIKVNVKNIGGTEGQYITNLIVDNTILDNKRVIIANGCRETLSFDYHINISDANTIEIDRFIIPITYLNAAKWKDPQVICIRGSQRFNDNLDDSRTIQLKQLKLDKAPLQESVISNNYVWIYDSTEWEWELQIPASIYSYFKNLKRPSIMDLSDYVTNRMDEKYIKKLAFQLNKTSEEMGFGPIERVEFVASFIQALPYTSDMDTTGYRDYPRYPIETLFDYGGDCEDKAILIADLLNEMGQNVALIYFPGHLGIGILSDTDTYGNYFKYNNITYFYLEVTDKGWRIGEIPVRLTNVPAIIQTLD